MVLDPRGGVRDGEVVARATLLDAAPRRGLHTPAARATERWWRARPRLSLRRREAFTRRRGRERGSGREREWEREREREGVGEAFTLATEGVHASPSRVARWARWEWRLGMRGKSISKSLLS